MLARGGITRIGDGQPGGPGLTDTAIALGALVMAACSNAASGPAAAVEERRATANVACDADNGGITLSPGFCASLVADQVACARHLVVSQNGDVYVATDASTGPGGVLALRDRDRYGHADVAQYVGDNGADSLAINEDFLYVAYRDRIVR